jgi:hypothetical protein
MKKLTPVLLVVLFAACSKKADLPATNSIQQQLAKAPEACSFGITVFNKARRPEIQEVFVETKRRGRREDTETQGTPAATILLDFDGQQVSNTLWNNGSLTCEGANLTNAEIEKILVRVSEDFAPFNVVVTTDEMRYNLTNPAKRMRVVVTESWEWYGAVGGIAYYDSFTWGNNTPCFVFSTLLNYNEKFIAEAISHEVGHTLGLRHQASFSASCSFLSEYNEGQGNGELGWAPIMGIGYYRNVTTWHKGALANGCGNVQDDVAILDHILGRKPDANKSIEKAENLAQYAEGMINDETDTDYYFVDLKQNAVVDVKPFCLGDGIGANLDVRMNIYNKKGEFVRSVTLNNTLSVSTPLERGKYYIGVESTTNTYASSRHGMLGRYAISVN